MDKEQILIEKNLPHNFLAEKMILNCLLINSETMDRVINIISIEAFYFKNHQQIYQALIFMHKNSLPIDILSLLAFLQENGLLRKIGGIKVLVELMIHVPNIVYLEDYIGLVKEKFLRRSLIKLGYKLINSGYISNVSVESILTNLETELVGLTTEINRQKIEKSSQLLNKIFAELKENFLTPTLPGVTSGFYQLDFLTQGFQKSDLIIIAGRPSIGKTAFSLNIALNVIKSSQLPVLFFSLEMSKKQLMYRVLSIETNINSTRLKSGKLYKNDWIKLNKMLKILSKLPFFIDDTPNLSIQDLRSKIKTILFEQSQIGLVIIDYLQLMQNSSLTNGNRVQELSQITRSLKNLAREFNIPIIALSQLSRNVENRVDQVPILSDLRESGSIEQDADLVLMLYRLKTMDPSLLSDQTELLIAKQRNGPVGKIKLTFDEKQMRFLDMEV